jgi:hypothetical protein
LSYRPVQFQEIIIFFIALPALLGGSLLLICCAHWCTTNGTSLAKSAPEEIFTAGPWQVKPERVFTRLYGLEENGQGKVLAQIFSNIAFS